MKFTDFRYNEMYLSDVDCIVCTFDGTGGLDSISNGSEITFNTIPVKSGSKHELSSTQYDDCIEATFQICKNPEGKSQNDEMYFSTDEIRYISSWLNRKKFHPFTIIGEDYIGLTFMASFNIKLLKLGANVVGLELTMHTDRPFALREEYSKKVTLRSGNMTVPIYVDTDEEGYIYPVVKITPSRAGNLTIENDKLPGENLLIKNCSVNEVITLDYPIITTSLPSHKIQNDFNWEFLKLVKSFNVMKNTLKISLPCTFELTYLPVAKINL